MASVSTPVLPRQSLNQELSTPSVAPSDSFRTRRDYEISNSAAEIRGALVTLRAALRRYRARRGSSAQCRLLATVIEPALEQLEKSLRHAGILPRLHDSDSDGAGVQ